MYASPTSVVAFGIPHGRPMSGARRSARDALFQFLFVAALLSGVFMFYLFYRFVVLDEPSPAAQASRNLTQESGRAR